MITAAMKSKGSFDRNSILSAGNARSQGAFTSQNITTLNRAGQGSFAPSHAAGTASAGTPARTPQQNSAGTAHSRRQAAPAVSQSAARTAPSRHQIQPAAPALSAHRMPRLSHPLQKGQKALLGNGTPGVLRACFGWNASNAQCDADVSAFLLGADGKVPGDSWFVFYGQEKSPDRSCHLQSGLPCDRQCITVDFTKLNPDVKKIVFVLTINEAFEKRLHFGMMKDAYMRILDKNNAEIASFPMTEYYSNVISMMIGEIYEYRGSWKFNAVGNGVAKDLAGLCALYGVAVSN